MAVRLLRGLKETNYSCLEWQKGKNDKGYGWISVEGTCHYTHRVMMEFKLGRILASNEVVMHKCDNPKCSNPEHLLLGDLKMNVADAVQKGRLNPRGKKKNRLTPEKVLEIKLAQKFGNQGVMALAVRFICGEQTIRDIRDGYTWKNVKLPEKPSFEYDPFADD